MQYYLFLYINVYTSIHRKNNFYMILVHGIFQIQILGMEMAMYVLTNKYNIIKNYDNIN